MTPTDPAIVAKGRETLLALAARCEAATGADRELDCRIWAALNGGGFDTFRAVVPNFDQWQARRYTASLDAAMTLVPEGWDWACGTGRREHMTENGKRPWAWCAEGSGFKMPLGLCLAASPALALTAAALRVRAGAA